MCLAYRVKTKEKNTILKKLPEEDIVVYRVMTYIAHKKSYFALFSYFEFKTGVNKADTKTTIPFEDVSMVRSKYKSGFHSFLSETDAEAFRLQMKHPDNMDVVKCTIKKSWITTMGQQQLPLCTTKVLTVVSNKIHFPSQKKLEKNEIC